MESSGPGAPAPGSGIRAASHVAALSRLRRAALAPAPARPAPGPPCTASLPGCGREPDLSGLERREEQPSKSPNRSREVLQTGSARPPRLCTSGALREQGMRGPGEETPKEVLDYIF